MASSSKFKNELIQISNHLKSIKEPIKKDVFSSLENVLTIRSENNSFKKNAIIWFNEQQKLMKTTALFIQRI